MSSTIIDHRSSIINHQSVAVVCRGCGESGSVARVAMRQARELSRHFQVVVISDSFPVEPQGYEVTGLRGRDEPRNLETPQPRFAQVPVHRFRALRRFAHVPHELSFARAARRMLAKLQPKFAIVHSHVVGHRSARPSGIPFGLVMHGDVFDRPAGMYDPLLTRLYRHDTPRAYAEAALVFAISPYMGELAMRGGADPSRVVTVPNGIEPALLGPHEKRPSNDGPLQLLFVGRLAIEKGVEYLIDACARLRVDYRLSIVGEGPLAAALRERAAPHADRITFRGPIPRDRLGAEYAAADLSCNPALSEALPTVVLESLAVGTPVLATDIGAHRFLIEPGKNGLLVPVRDAAAMARAIESLDRETLARMAANARPSVEAFSWPVVGDRIAELIRPFVG